MTTLHLGVIDLPYADASSYREVGAKKPKTMPDKETSTITTGDVAEILEAEYHVMEVFYTLHEEFVAEQLTDSMLNAFESIELGAPVGLDPTGDATAAIAQRFREFITNKEIESLGIPGVPTKAAQEGHSRRFKNPYKKRKSRPSFLDTGLYVGAAIAWVD